MKKIKILLLLSMSIFFISCGNEQPILNDENNPYIVYSIKDFNSTHASYYNDWQSSGGTNNNFFGSWSARIVLPKGMYNIGDTITLTNN